ncbi:MAG TPA: hypothetical protein VK388_15445 [Pyrinomonadaceae bacterium]|nr:hypothetical protein [Pyrinomonadaceae bacterium]
MSDLIHRIRVSNDRDRFITVWLEPWGEDYGMSPGDEFEVIADGVGEDFYFHVICEEKGMKIYAEGEAARVGVFQGTELLSCGHERREGEW